MLIGNRLATWKCGKRLPYDAEVEYIRSTGIQYIDTGVIIDTNDYGAYYKFKVNSFNDGTSGVSGTNSGEAKLYINFWGNGLYVRYGNYLSSKITEGFNAAGVNEVNLNGGVITLNGSDIATATLANRIAEDLPVFVFAWNDRGTAKNFCYMDLYAFKFYKDGGVAADFIPVRKGSVGYLYDRVSGRLFGNAGTGAFVAGPDKAAWTNPYVTDG